MTIDIDEARELFARRIAAWLAEDIDAYVDCWHDDMQVTLPGGRVVSGIAAYRRMVEQSSAWAEPVSFDVHSGRKLMSSSVKRCTVPAARSPTHTSPSDGWKPTRTANQSRLHPSGVRWCIDLRARRRGRQS